MTRIIIYITLVLFLITSCEDQKNYNILIANANEILATNPDSTIILLQNISLPKNISDSTKAKYWLTIGQAHYDTSKSMTDDSLLLYTKEYYNDFQMNPKRFVQSRKLAAFYLLWNDKVEEGLNLLKETLTIAEQHKDTIGMINLYHGLAKYADDEYDVENGLLASKRLLELDKNSPYYYNYYKDIAIIYFYMNQADSCFMAFEEGLKFVANIPDNEWAYYDLNRNYSDVLNEFNYSQKAIDLQRKLMDTDIGKENRSISYLSLSRFYLNLNQLDSANYYMQKAKESVPNYFHADFALNNLYLIQDVILDYANKDKLNLNKTMLFSNKAYNKNLKRESTLSQRTNNLQLSEQRNLQLTIVKQYDKILLLSIILILLIATSIVYFYIQKRRKAFVRKEEELEVFKNLLIESEKSNNNQKKDEHFFKRILLQQLGIIRLAATSPTAQNQEFLQQIATLDDKDIPVDSLLNWTDLYKVIDSIYNNFYTKISSKYKDILIDKEIQLCCLLIAEFSTKEASVVSQQSVRTIYQRKTTIRQKLQMNEKEDIIDFLKQ